MISRGLSAKAGWIGAEAPREAADHLVVRAALARRIDQLRAEQDMLLAAALVDVVVLDEHRGGQDDIGHAGGVGHHLLVHDGEQILAARSRA